MIYIKFLTGWGRFKVGDVSLFDDGKGSRLIAVGIAEKAEKPSEEKTEPIVKQPEVETATVDVIAETAEVTPKRGRPKKQVKDKNGLDSNDAAGE